MKFKFSLFFALFCGICICFPKLALTQLRLESLVFEGLGKPFLDNVSSIDLSPDGQQVYTTSFDDHAITVFNRNEVTGVLTLVETQKNEIKGVAGLGGSYSVKVSPDGKHVYATGKLDNALVFFARDPISGTLSYQGMYQDGVDGIDGLSGAFLIEMSADGNYLYLTGSADNAVAVFQRNVITGALTQRQVVKNGQAGVDNMNFPIDLKMTADGEQLIVSSFGDNSIVVFNRNTNSGLLSFTTAYKNGVNGLAGAYGLSVSPSGEDVYVACSDANSIVHFRRYPNSGILVFTGVQQNGVNGVSGLAGTSALTVSPDGTYLYAAGTGADAMVLFERNMNNGELTFASKIDNGMNGVSGLDYPVAITVSKNTKDIYVAGFGANALLLFEREATSGQLNFAYAEQGANQGIRGLKGAAKVNFSADGTHCYVAGELADAVSVFSREPTTGALSFVSTIEDGNGVDGLNGVNDVVVSADGNFVYTAGFWDNAVAVFSRNPISGNLTYIDRYKDGLFGVNGLSGTNALVISPNQKHLYASGFWDHGLVLFTRNEQDGTLDFETAYLDGSNGVNGLENISHIEMSADGNYVYAAGKADNAIAVFSRDVNSGNLTYQGIYQDGTNGITGLKGVQKIKISLDGEQLYAISEEDRAVVHFQRDVQDGNLTFIDVYQDGSAGGTHIGLEGLTDINFSNDNQIMYLSSSTENAVSVYQRDVQTGTLTFEKIVYDGIDGVNGLEGASSVLVSPDGQFIYTSGATDNAVSVFSCTYEHVLQERICMGEAFEVGGMTFTTSGQYNETIVDGNCTTIINLDLLVEPETYQQSVELCNGDIFILGDQAYNTSGTYSANFVSSMGCDSMVVVDLSVVDAFSPTFVEASICEGETYMLGNEALNETGIYEAMLTSMAGCDSMVQVNLDVVETIESDLNYTICEGEFFVIGTTNYHTNGFFSETLTGQSGCDSIVNLVLTIIPTEAVITESICEGDGYEFGEETYFEAGTYTGTYITSSGCEVQATLQLSVQPALVVTPEVIDDLGNGLGAVNLTVSGGVAPYSYQWSNGATTANPTNLFPGIYEVTVTDEIDCERILSIPVNFTTATTNANTSSLSIQLSPNPVRSNERIRLELTNFASPMELQLTLHNSVGAQLWTRQTNAETEIIELFGPTVAGLYYLKVSDRSNRSQLLRFIVQ